VIGRARLASVMVLSYSRQIFLRFFLDARSEDATNPAAYSAVRPTRRPVATTEQRLA
jgi:hypothetical protein